MTWPLSINEEHGLKLTNQNLRIAADMPPAEEATKQDPDSTNEEAQAAETTQTGRTNIATSANSKDIGKRNAEKGSRKTNPAETPKDEHIG